VAVGVFQAHPLLFGILINTIKNCNNPIQQPQDQLSQP
jgi:hypothetical protein